MNLTTLAIAGLMKHVLETTLIPRVKEEKSELDKTHFKNLLKHYEDIVSKQSLQLYFAQSTMTGLMNHFKYLRREDLEDFIGTVINFTIQSQKTDFGKQRKSLCQFWTQVFDLSKEPNTFEKTFSYFLYKAVQSETRGLFNRRKYEMNLFYNEKGECLALNELKSENDEIDNYNKMTEFEKKLISFKEEVLSHPKLDEIDKKIFERWLALKIEGNFTNKVNISKDVVDHIKTELANTDMPFKASTLAFRWKRVQKIMQVVMRRSTKNNFS